MHLCLQTVEIGNITKDFIDIHVLVAELYPIHLTPG
jgi:hypothetical protein